MRKVTSKIVTSTATAKRATPFRSAIRNWIAAGLVAPAVLIGAPVSTENAVANGDTRTLSFHHMNTGEDFTVTFKRNGYFDESALEKLNWGLRDWHVDEATKMDPRLFDIVWEVYQQSGSSESVHVVSAYRSPGTNAALRRRSSGVAKNSQHMYGKAMDFFLPDIALSKVRELGLQLQRGGVGYYPTGRTGWIHLDAGGVRYWPRMSHDQLARVFPDGKTVFIPSDGQPMARYQEALAEVEARGGSAVDMAPAKGKGLFAWLFGGSNGEGDEEGASQPMPSSKGKRGTAMAKVAPAGDEESGGAAVVASKAKPEPAKVVASLETKKPVVLAEAPAAAAPQEEKPAVADVPAPPKRPKELNIMAFVAPLPPSRPTELAMLVPKNDAITKLLDKPEPQAPVAVPALIAKGGKPAVAAPQNALAYAAPLQPVEEPPTRSMTRSVAPVAAAPAPVAAPVPVPAPKPVLAKAPAAPPKLALVAAKLDHTTLHAPINTTNVPMAALNGNATGLRQAAQRKAAPDLVGSALNGDDATKARIVSSFEPQVSASLHVNRFTGAAVKALSPEDGFKQLEDSALN